MTMKRSEQMRAQLREIIARRVTAERVRDVPVTTETADQYIDRQAELRMMDARINADIASEIDLAKRIIAAENGEAINDRLGIEHSAS